MRGRDRCGGGFLEHATNQQSRSRTSYLLTTRDATTPLGEGDSPPPVQTSTPPESRRSRAFTIGEKIQKADRYLAGLYTTAYTKQGQRSN